MTTSFSKLLAAAQRGGPGELSLSVPSDWMQGRSAFGGLSAALAVEAMRPLVAGLPLRTLQMTFFAPVPEGLVRARAQVVRSGKSATHVEANLFADGDTSLARVIGVFGAPRRSGAKVLPKQPDLALSEPVELPFIEGLLPSFTRHFRAKWLRGKMPFMSDDTRDHVLTVSMVDDGPPTIAHVLAFADMIPPIALSFLSAPAPGSTLAWMIELLVDEVSDLSLNDWRVDGTLHSALNGYTSQSVLLSGPDGRPIAISHQSMTIFG